MSGPALREDPPHPRRFGHASNGQAVRARAHMHFVFLRLLMDLSFAEMFETFLHTRFVGQKRFSLEGADTLIPMLDAFVEKAPELEAREIRTTFVQHLPGVATRYREYLPLFPAAAATMDLAGFDLVISSSHCVAKGVKPAPGALHLCYCHTPMRYVWDRYDDYFGPGRVRGPARFAIPLVARWFTVTLRSR